MIEFFNNHRSDFLFADNSFLIGMGSVFNLTGEPYFEYNVSDNGAEADCLAIASDWGMVGADIADSIIKYADENIQIN